MAERPLLVLLHGWGSSPAVWQPLIESLRADYEFYAPALPGHGNGSLTQHQLEPLASEILASVNRPAIWLGWSLGALIAMQAALLMPQRVSQLLIVSGTPAFVQQAGWDTAMSVDTFEQFQRDFAQNPGRTLQRFMALQVHGDQQAKVAQRQLALSAVTAADDIAWGLDVLRDSNLRVQLAAISCPMNCLYGERDALVPSAIASIMRNNFTAEVKVWPDVGHAPFVSQSEAFLDWFKEVAVHA